VVSGVISPVDRVRPSAADRERVAEVLRRACVDQRLSAETFARRLDVVYAAQTRAELDRLLGDVPEPRLGRRAVLAAVSWLSSWSRDLAAAWRQPRMQRLVLPNRERVLIGRSRWCDVVVPDTTVSARHAVLARIDDEWTVRDRGSRNGTYVNGWRVLDEIVVRPGDELALGNSRFVLAAPRP
jgi:hypothetical protein